MKPGKTMKPGKIKTTMVGANAADGFTMVELIIAMAVTAILAGAMIANYVSQLRASTTVRQVSQIQQQLRGSMYIMEQDIRAAGWTPEGAPGFGVTNVQRWSITDEATAPVPSAGGSPSLTLAYDWDPNNPATDDDGLVNEPTPAYRLFDDNSDGILDLVRDDGTIPRPLVAEGIEAIGFAYAFDNDLDGQLDRTAGNIIWAVDSDNDNLLDTGLDANGDGVIDLNDDIVPDFRITSADGAALVPPIPVDRIRMVRIWMLARAREGAGHFTNPGQSFLVGDQVVPNLAGGFTDNIRRRMLIKTVACRNTGL